MKISITINKEIKKFEIHPSELLIDVLRKNGYYGIKRGCMEGDCGACIVIINDKIINACLFFAAKTDGQIITTIEGISSSGEVTDIQKSYIEAGAIQCGYCTPGFILATKVLLDNNCSPSDEEIKSGLESNLCRCTGYVKQMDAVKSIVKNRLQSKK